MGRASQARGGLRTTTPSSEELGVVREGLDRHMDRARDGEHLRFSLTCSAVAFQLASLFPSCPLSRPPPTQQPFL